MCNMEPDWLIQRRGTLLVLGQFPGSSDCGYFCGKALSLLYLGNGNAEAIQVSRLDVYRARESYLQLTPQVLTHRHGHSIDLDFSGGFLERTLQLPGYLNHPLGGGRNGTAVWPQMFHYKGADPRYGAAFRTLDGREGHWTAVLGYRFQNRRQEYLVYDPAWIDRCLKWLDVSTLEGAFPSILSIVSTAMPAP
jgi:hypothetical protein